MKINEDIRPVTYLKSRAAIGLLKLMAQGEEDVRNGRSSGQGEVFARLDKKLQEANTEL
jgi:hypothetical protein